jgi:hypothetical protein
LAEAERQQAQAVANRRSEWLLAADNDPQAHGRVQQLFQWRLPGQFGRIIGKKMTVGSQPILFGQGQQRADDLWVLIKTCDPDLFQTDPSSPNR